MKKIPYRSCVVTKEKYPKWELIRVVKNNKNEVMVDLTGKLNGKGAYIKKDIDVLARARKYKLLDKYLEVKIDEKIYEELLDVISN